MASAVETGKKSSKNLNADINLVPFIDFLSICICFLLMTAVWIQVSSMEVKQAYGTSSGGGVTSQVEINVDFLSSEQLVIKLKEKRRVRASYKVRINDNTYGGVRDVVDKIIQSKTIDSATVTTSSKVTHETFVQVLDALRGSGITELGVNHGV